MPQSLQNTDAADYYDDAEKSTLIEQAERVSEIHQTEEVKKSTISPQGTQSMEKSQHSEQLQTPLDREFSVKEETEEFEDAQEEQPVLAAGEQLPIQCNLTTLVMDNQHFKL